MRDDEPNPASVKEPAEGSRENVKAEDSRKRNPHKSIEEFESTVDLPGRIDSGPEPDIFVLEIPPQK